MFICIRVLDERRLRGVGLEHKEAHIEPNDVLCDGGGRLFEHTNKPEHKVNKLGVQKSN